jgi:eukaryotic-like serine/threonine-protein kinase
MPIRIGDILGDYQVTGVLGRGGMGKVFRVRSLLTEREEAMKVVLPDVEENAELVDRFLREIKVHASLRHPNIAELRTALRIEDRLVMILELVEGVSLEERLREGPIDVASAAGYITQVLSALAFAHDRGVIHRDIKPANILIDAGGVVKLTDFGIARATGATHLTGVGIAVGTLPYMSPEQIRSGEVDARSDIYSLGLTFYEIVTGRRAIQADTEHGLMNAHFNVMPPDPATINPFVPPAISAAILRALAKEPGQRFQTALDFRAALTSLSPVQSSAAALAGAVSTAELADLEARLSRALGPIARRLVADAARHYGTIAEIRRALAAQIEDPKARDHFLKTNPGAIATATVKRPPTAAVSFDPATLDRLVQALAPYLGPIAKIVVSRAARNARTAEELQNVLAAELPSAADRQRFLASVRSSL